MSVNLKALSTIFYKKAQNILPLGKSTITPARAQEIGSAALEALKNIDRYVLMSYPHANFKAAMEMLSSGKIPDSIVISNAVQEFNSGLSNFSNMASIPVEDLLYIM